MSTVTFFPLFTRRAAVMAAGVLLTGGLAQAQPAPMSASGADTSVALREAVDRNPDPGIVEIDLEARVAEVEVEAGLKVKAWTYDGGLPGPLIRTKVGDRLIVHFKNQSAGGHHHPLARRARADRDGRRPRHLTTRDEDRATCSPTTSWCAMPDSSGITRT